MGNGKESRDAAADFGDHVEKAANHLGKAFDALNGKKEAPAPAPKPETSNVTVTVTVEQ